MNFQKDTSLITILSSHHGRLRREQRDIDKRDLQRALKHGTKQKAWGQRWMVEYDGITFITDSTMRREVTAYPSPLPDMPMDFEMETAHTKAKDLLQKKPGLSTSHTVIVIDNSGSMLAKKCNVHLYRDSQNAAFSMTALEFVADQLFNQTAVNSDLVSLIKFDKHASVEISREPIGWPVYNELLKHRNTDRYVNRMAAPINDRMYGESNYITAIDKAIELLEEGYHDKCALALFFFSDGGSTDHHTLGTTRSVVNREMYEKVHNFASRFGQSFTVTMMGLGDPHDDFSSLKTMSKAASDAGAKGSFMFCNKTANSITSAISSLVTSTTESRVALQEGRRRGYTQRKDLVSEDDATVKFDWTYYRICDHLVYHPRHRQFRPDALLPQAAVDVQRGSSRSNNPPPFLAFNRNYIGKGAERVAFRCRLSDKESVDGFVFDTMVAKETKDVEFIEDKVAFHEGFVETQDLANYLAKEFNRHLRGLSDYNPSTTPQVVFLNCSVLLLRDPDWPTGIRGVLVEKKLDTERFTWTKWNDNNGMVDGKRVHAPLDVEFELKQLEKDEEASKFLGAITEEDEEEEEEDSADDNTTLSDADTNNLERHADKVDENHHESLPEHGIKMIKPSDYLQAFTHFTYRYTNKKAMVCDLQGIFNTDMCPPTFELTDPAIHYESIRGRRMVFGRTDKGKSGMKAFFNTHKCNKICKYLQLSAKNKNGKENGERIAEDTSNQ